MKKYITTILMVSSLIGLQAQTDDFVVVEDTLAADTVVALPWPLNVQVRLDSLLRDPLMQTTQLGLLVYDMTADSTLYGYGARQTLRPASTMKLLTAVTALDRLGGNYQLRTSLYYTGTIDNQTLKGDLYCVGGMDPLFDGDDMQAFVEGLHRMGVDTIRGRLVADTSFKEENLLGEGWCWDDDNPQLTPLLISRKDEFMTCFQEKLQQGGIVVDAPCVSGRLPNGACIITSRFHALDQILYPMMKESDNLYAESVFFQIAASSGSRPGKAAHARQLIKQTLGKAGVSETMYKVADGSGLSLYNYVTPELLVRLLIYAYRNTSINMYLYPSLPVAGQDGTLKKRMTGPATNGKVRAKTGTLTGISSLAGYCVSANGHILAFCIINQGVMRNADGRAFQEKVCKILCEP